METLYDEIYGPVKSIRSLVEVKRHRQKNFGPESLVETGLKLNGL